MGLWIVQAMKTSTGAAARRGMSVVAARISLAGIVLGMLLAAVPAAHAQDFVLTALVLVNAQSPVGYNPSPQAPGEFQRFTERYLEHLQIPYELLDIATQ